MAQPETAKVFAREATGLVRELGLADHFLISQGIVLLINGFVTTVLYAPYFFPGANLLIAFVLGGVPAFCMAYVYGKLSAGMPRSGGDYVWSTRIMGPLFGVIQMVFLVGALVYYNVFNLWDIFVIGLGPSFFGVGAALKNSGIAQLAIALGGVGLGFPGGLALLTLLLVVALLGVHVYKWFVRVSVPIYLAIVALFIIGVALLNPSSVQRLFDQAMSFAGLGTTYNGILQNVASSGFNAAQFSLSNTLLAAIPWGFLTYVGFNFSSYSAGETKNYSTSIMRAFLLSVFLTAVILAVMTLLVYAVFGVSWINALSYYVAVNPSSVPVSPFPNFFVSLANPAIGAIVGIGLCLGWAINSTGLIIFSSRMLFAASLDRVLPSRFASVSDRFHSPQWPVILIGVLSAIYLTVYWNLGAIAVLLNTSIVVPIGLALPLFAAFLFPIVRKDLYLRIYGSMKGAWLLSLTGLIGAASFGFYVFAETTPIISGTFLGASLGLSYGAVAVLIVIAVAIYLVGRSRMRAAGIDPQRVFQEIPPE